MCPSEISTDLLLGNATIVPGPNQSPINDGAILIRGKKIAAIGKSSDLKINHPNASFFDAKDHIVIPGLINSHTHVAMGFFRGLGHGKKDMIESFLFPAEKKLTQELLKPLSYSYILDGVRSGVTSFVDHYYFSSGIRSAFQELGVRAWLGETIADLGGAFPGRESLERAKDLYESSQPSDLIRYVMAPHAADTVSRALMQEIAEYARSKDLPIHLHLSQTQGEFDRVKTRESLTPVQFAESCGVLGQKTLAVHLTSATFDDVKAIAKSGSTLGWCPSSTIIYHQLADIKEFLDQNIPVALGTDCPASCDHADMLSEARTAGLLLKDRKVSSSRSAPDELLAMMTTRPAEVLGVKNEIGTLEPGKFADLVVLEQRVSGLPAANALANIIYSMGSRDVNHVMINGKWIISNKLLASGKESEFKSDYLRAVLEIQKRVGM